MEVLLEEVDLHDAIRHTSVETLDVLPGGRRAGDPGELLTVEFPALLAQLERSTRRSSSTHAGRADLATRASWPASPRRRSSSRAPALEAPPGAHRDRAPGLDLGQPAAAVLNYSRTVRSSSYYCRPSGEGAEQLRPRRRTQSRRAAGR